MKTWRSCRCYLAIGLSINISPVLAFDGDMEIYNPNFNPENFLDLKAYEFSKPMDQQWYTTNNGWRMTGGSVDIDRLFLDGAFKINQDFSEKFTMRLKTEQRLFYTLKPKPHTMIEMDFHPWNPDFSISFLSNTAHDKRQVDMGGAVRLGQYPWRYLRFSWLDVDALYNDKNSYDDSYYSVKPHTKRLEGALKQGRWQTRFNWEQDTSLKFIMPEESSIFQHHGHNFRLNTDYFFDKQIWIGIDLRGFKYKKHLDEPADNRKQDLAYTSMDIYWQGNWPNNKYQSHAGVRLDRFTNQFRDMDTPADHMNYLFSTWQIYSTLAHDYRPYAAWNIGVYLGKSYEKKNYLSGTTGDRIQDRFQGKLRASWQYHSTDKNNILILHFSFNLDELKDDPGDGAGMTYQGLF